MAHTYWDPKGIVKRRPGGYTYYGGNTAKSAQYKERYVPHYNPETTLSNVDRTDKLHVLQKSENWNTYQKRMWYQDHLDHTTPEYEDFPGIHAEWRKEGEFAKSYQRYNSKFVYDFRVNMTTTDANGVESTEEFRTADHTAITKLRRDVEERDRFDIRTPATIPRRTVDFADFNTEDNNYEEGKRDEEENRRLSNCSNDSNKDIQYFNGEHGQTFNITNSPIQHGRPHSASATSIHTRTHPAVNPGLCREHPKETFKKKEKFPLFWSAKQKEDFRHHKSSSGLLDTTSGRHAHDTSMKSEFM